MKSSHFFGSRRARAAGVALLAAAALPGAWAAADSITFKSGAGQATYPNVTITRLEGNSLFFLSNESGRESSKPLDSIITIASDAEKKLTQAEQDYAGGQWDKAVTDYQSAIDSSTAPWVKARATTRLIDAAARSHQFMPQVAAFIRLAETDPADARKHKPSHEGVKGDDLNAAIAAAESAIASTRNKASVDLLKEFEADLYTAKGDAQGAMRVLGGAPAAHATGAPAVGEPAGGAPAAAGASPDLVLARAKAAMAARQYAQVITEIDGNRASFTAPAQQAEALYDLAEAQAATAGGNAAVLQDAAINYVRYVAHFGNTPEGANWAAALYKVAMIEEQLNKPAEAAQVYERLAGDPRLKGTPIAEAAAKKATALRGK